MTSVSASPDGKWLLIGSEAGSSDSHFRGLLALRPEFPNTKIRRRRWYWIGSSDSFAPSKLFFEHVEEVIDFSCRLGSGKTEMGAKKGNQSITADVYGLSTVRLDRPPDAHFGTQQTVGVGRSCSLMRCSAMNQRRPALNVTAHSWSVFPFCSSLRWIISVMTPRASRHCDDGQTTFTSSPTRSRFTEELQFLE